MLLDQRNAVVLSDFGIALLAQSSRLLSTQEVVGTAAYMAPERQMASILLRQVMTILHRCGML